jgi:hypothetical protein
MELLTFKDLEFLEHPTGGGIQARLDFDNGWGVSVVSLERLHGPKRDLYELAVLKEGHLHYDNPVAGGDVREGLKEKDISSIMIEIQSFEELI